ncbi:MAG: hypothetical protein QF673_03085 [Candidatus Hydrothermarchaeota archaeon]|nr:hypothetical protein [Candidatus Hydrothermarchaeota archaeon]
MALPQLPPIGLIVVGLVLLIVAPRLVGFVVKVIGLALLAVGVAAYFYEPLGMAFPQFAPALPVIAGLALIFVGKGIAQTVVRIAGLAVIVWGFLGLGLI